MWRNRNPCIWLAAMQTLWKTECQFFQKLKMDLLYDLAILVLSIDPKELKSGNLTNEVKYLYTKIYKTLMKELKKT